MNGVLNILKPPGMTSHDVVNRVRRLTGEKKSGHTGTLDPGAAGVLPVCTGRATKIIQFMTHDKKYRAELVLGKSTSTQDSFGTLLEHRDCSALTESEIKEVMQDFTGVIKQIPPMASAVKHRGKKLYQLYRAGEEVARKERSVEVYDLQVIDILGPGTPHPRVLLDISCSAGTYVRTICSDIGQRLGYCAYMSFLLRTRAGIFTLGGSNTLEELQYLQEAGELNTACTSIGSSLQNLPSLTVDKNIANYVLNGNQVSVPLGDRQQLQVDQLVKLEDPPQTLAVGKIMANKPANKNECKVQPVKVLA